MCNTEVVIKVKIDRGSKVILELISSRSQGSSRETRTADEIVTAIER